MEIAVGQQAPDFTLYNTEKKKVTLSQFKGKPVLLLFFPFAFSSVCTAELCGVRDNFEQYNTLNVTVLGISVDSLYTLAKFKELQGLNFDLLSDFNKEVATRYDALFENFSYDMKGVAKRAAFAIDKEGKIQYAEYTENPGVQPNFTAIQSILQLL